MQVYAVRELHERNRWTRQIERRGMRPDRTATDVLKQRFRANIISKGLWPLTSEDLITTDFTSAVVS
jgi:flagellar biosynthesis regulator FlaF